METHAIVQYSLKLLTALFYFFCTLRYVPIGVLFDLLCADPERPWNLIVRLHFSLLLLSSDVLLCT